MNLISADLTMGLRVQSLYSLPVEPIRLTITRHGATVTISWNGGGTLISSDSLSEPIPNWIGLPNATSPLTLTASEAKRFYALRF